jgi:hypothetical protein
MRAIFTVAVLITLSALATPSANAQPASAQKVLNEAPLTTCLCHFGYGNVCQSRIACDNEGGRCGSTCTPPNATFINR